MARIVVIDDDPSSLLLVRTTFEAGGHEVVASDEASTAVELCEDPLVDATRKTLSVTVRLATLSPEERLDPVILDRVWSELNHVRPAGVRLVLAVGEKIVRGS